MNKKPLTKVAKIIAGQSPPSTTYNHTGDGLPFFQGKADFQERSPRVRMWCNSGRRKEALPGDVLISVRAPVGAVNLCDQTSIIGRGLSAIRPTDELHGEYLFHFLRCHERQIASLGTGSTFQAITQDTLGKIEIPLPPLDDQKRIAYLLSKVEGLIAQRKEHLQQLDDLLKSVFLTMFGDPTANDKGWEIGPFAKIIEYARNGLSPAKGGTESGLVYTLSAVTGDHFQPIYKAAQFDRIHSKYFPNENDFLICRGNGNIELVGKAYFHPAVPENVMFPDTIIAVRIQPGAINRPFLEAIWKTAFIRSQIEQSARTTNGTYKINQGTISALNVPYPPLQIQNRFGAIADSITAAQFSLRQHLSTTEQLFAGLSRQAFKGELDLSRILVPETVEALVTPVRFQQTEVATVDSGFDLEVRSTTDTLASSNARKVMIAQWLNAYAQPLGTQTFTSDSLMKLVREKLSDLQTKDDALEIDYEVSAADYDHVKDWIFQHLESKHLTQLYDDANNRVQISFAKD